MRPQDGTSLVGGLQGFRRLIQERQKPRPTGPPQMGHQGPGAGLVPGPGGMPFPRPDMGIPTRPPMRPPQPLMQHQGPGTGLAGPGGPSPGLLQSQGGFGRLRGLSRMWGQ